MPRVKRGTISNKTRKNILKEAKGFRFGRSKKEKEAKTALLHAYTYARRDRRKKKGVFRHLFQNQIGGALTETNYSYSKFISGLKNKNIKLDRKILATLAEKNPEVFSKIIEKIGE